MSSNNPATFSELYSTYAAGCLDPAFALLVETQSSLRADIADRVCQSEVISGIMLERETATDMTSGAVDRALSLIDDLEVSAATEKGAVRAASNAIDELLALPDPLRAQAIEAAGADGWQFTSPGIRRLRLDCDSDAEVELYRIEPGASVPRHTHEGYEATLIAAGGFTDETGSFGPGDVTMKGPDDTHRPVADLGEPCYALAVRDGGLRFTGAMGLVQRILGA